MGIGEVGELVRRSTVHLRQKQGSGSGVIWNSQGLVITNAHVVRGAGDHAVAVELWDGRIFPTKVGLRDDRGDLAILNLETNGLPCLPVRETPVRVGELVIAVGNPMGFTGALTTGVVHGTGGSFVQASIRLAPGNSGGPLVDASGRLVGINTMITGGGLALAIPANLAQRAVERFLTPSRARLGVTLQPVSTGLLIVGMEKDGPAERASLMIGDVLLTDWRTLANAGEKTGSVKVRFLRGSQRQREVVVSLPGSARGQAERAA